jgi:hypothetical protein
MGTVRGLYPCGKEVGDDADRSATYISEYVYSIVLIN